MDKLEDWRIVLNPEFQNKIFSDLIYLYGIKFLVKKFDMTHSIIYHYKNNRIRSLPFRIFFQIDGMLGLNETEYRKQILDCYDAKAQIKRYLDIGREIRKERLIQLKEDIPKIKDILKRNNINFEKWLRNHIILSGKGIRNYQKLQIGEKRIITKFSNYSNGIKKEFTNIFPRQIRIDKDFQYFFGLWVGDRLGKGRFGIGNKEKSINLETARILRKYYQKPCFELNIHKDINLPEVKVDKIVYIKAKTKIKGYCIWVYSQNATLFKFFDCLIQDLDFVLKILPNPEIFFAGLFDAEGNVNLEDKTLKWACQDRVKIEIYKKYLSKLGLFDRYDGCCLICKNYKIFNKLIFPYIKHKNKINDFNLLMKRKANLPLKFLKILKIIKEHEGGRATDIAKALKRAKIYAQINVLEDLGLVEKNGYPKKIFVTEKGLNLLRSD